MGYHSEGDVISIDQGHPSPDNQRTKWYSSFKILCTQRTHRPSHATQMIALVLALTLNRIQTR